jgi:integrase
MKMKMNSITMRTNFELTDYAPCHDDDADSDDISIAEHASEPIKRLEDIYRMSDWFIANGQYRDNMLFILGINFGLRISDLLRLKFEHIMHGDLTFRKSFAILEQKTANTRKRRRNRHVAINEAVKDAVSLYAKHADIRPGDYMFRKETKRGRHTDAPLHRNTAERILKKAGKALGLNAHIATHTLRKTFAYHQMMMSKNDPRKLLLLQQMFGHSTSAQTLEYIGITREEIKNAYMSLNLGANQTKYNIKKIC